MWCVAELDEEYIRRMEDVLALYEKPLKEEDPVVCIDEKPVVLHQDTRAPSSARPGRLARRDYEYSDCYEIVYSRVELSSLSCGTLWLFRALSSTHFQADDFAESELLTWLRNPGAHSTALHKFSHWHKTLGSPLAKLAEFVFCRCSSALRHRLQDIGSLERGSGRRGL
jgi:hypothetical protein